MGFTDNLNAVHNPATLYLRWKGGAEKIRENGEEKIEGGKLIYWDKETETEKEVSLPLVVCPLEITYSYNGFVPDKGRFWSNEILDFGSTIITVHRTGEDDEVIASGTYEQIKDKAYAAGARLQTNVYCYCKGLGGIIRLNLGGSAKSAWKEFVKKSGRSRIYECPVQIEVGEVQESKLGPFVPPKYTLGQNYEKNVVAALTEQDKVVIEYLKYISERAPQEPSDVVSTDIPENISQEIPGAEDMTDQIDLSEVPF